MAAIAYVSLNPVRARLVKRARDWRWSSVRASRSGEGLTDTAPVLDRAADFAGLLRTGEDEALSMALRRAETVGRPLGGGRFLARIERTLGRDPRPRKRGPEPKKSALSP